MTTFSSLQMMFSSAHCIPWPSLQQFYAVMYYDTSSVFMLLWCSMIRSWSLSHKFPFAFEWIFCMQLFYYCNRLYVTHVSKCFYRLSAVRTPNFLQPPPLHLGSVVALSPWFWILLRSTVISFVSYWSRYCSPWSRHSLFYVPHQHLQGLVLLKYWDSKLQITIRPPIFCTVYFPSSV
jgi:hypothetical protein